MMEDGFCLRHGGTNNRFLSELKYSPSLFNERGNTKVTSQEPLFMANAQVADSGAVLIQEIETIGIYLGPIILALSLFLMFKGHEKLQLAAGITGAGIGYVLTPLVHGQFEQYFGSEIRVLYILLGMVIVIAGLMAAFIEYSIRMMAFFFIYIIFSSSFKFLSANGFEFVQSEEVSGVMAIVAFFLVRMVRGVLPLLVSAFLGSIGVMSAMLLLSGNPLSLLGPSNTSSLLMIGVLFTLSFTLQYRQIKKKKAKEKREANPEMPEMRQVGAGNRIQSRRRKAGDLPDLRDFS